MTLVRLLTTCGFPRGADSSVENGASSSHRERRRALGITGPLLYTRVYDALGASRRLQGGNLSGKVSHMIAPTGVAVLLF